jgi:YD repeat-containing protein
MAREDCDRADEGVGVRIERGSFSASGHRCRRSSTASAIALVIEHANGQSGNITRVVSQNGRWLTFSYDGSNRITEVRDNIGRTVGYQYDASGRLWKVTDPEGGITEYTYDTSHRMLTIKDPLATGARIELPPALASATYDNADQIATFGGTSFTLQHVYAETPLPQSGPRLSDRHHYLCHQFGAATERQRQLARVVGLIHSVVDIHTM